MLFQRAAAHLSEQRAVLGEWGTSDPPSNSSIGGFVEAGQTVSEYTALQIAAVYGSVSIIADACSTLPIQTFSSENPATRRELPLGPLITAPYAEISRIDWVVQYVTSMALRGNFFGHIIERDAQLYPSQIQPVHPAYVTVRRIRSGPNAGRPEYRFQGQRVPVDDVFHVRNLTVPGSLVGLNPIEQLRVTLGLARAQDLYGGAYFANSANPSGVIEIEGEMNDLETRRLAIEWRDRHGGTENAHMPAVLTGGAKFKAISITPDDSQFLQSRGFSQGEISGMIFRVPPHMIGLVDRTTSWGCLPGDAMVFTTSGPVPIVDVVEGDEVWSLDEQKGMVPAKVTKWQMTGYKRLRTIETTGRTLRATDNHRVPVRRYHGLKDGRTMGTCGWENVWLRADEIKLGDFLMVPHGLGSDEGSRVAPTGRPLTIEAMELCGMYTGDGSQDKNRVELAHERDADYMDHYRSSIRAEFGVEPYVDKRGTRTRFSSVAARELLESGFTGNAHTKRVPRWVFGLSRDLQCAFLRGYVDSDGCVQRGRVLFSSCNRRLLEDVRHLCVQIGAPTGRVVIGRPAGVGEINGQPCRSSVKYHLSLSSRLSNLVIGSNSPHKAVNFNGEAHGRTGRYDRGWMGVANRRPQDRRQSPGHGWQYEDIKLQRVTKISVGEAEVPVYDITVTGTASFVADGVLVHNTGIAEQEQGFVTNTLMGYLVRLEEALTAVGPKDGRVNRFNVSRRLRGNRLQRYQAYGLGLASGFLCPDDARAEEDMAPLPDGLGQTYMVPINSQTIKQAVAESTIPASQSAPQGEGGRTNG